MVRQSLPGRDQLVSNTLGEGDIGQGITVDVAELPPPQAILRAPEAMRVRGHTRPLDHGRADLLPRPTNAHCTTSRWRLTPRSQTASAGAFPRTGTGVRILRKAQVTRWTGRGIVQAASRPPALRHSEARSAGRRICCLRPSRHISWHPCPLPEGLHPGSDFCDGLSEQIPRFARNDRGSIAPGTAGATPSSGDRRSS